MSQHLTIISYTQEMTNLFEPIALRVQAHENHRFVRCQRVGQLRELIVKAGRGETTRLDLVGHGSPSRFMLGDEMLVERRQELPKVFAALDKELHPDAEVRLVGCLTGVGEEGRAMLHAVSRALGGRNVVGMTDRVQPQDFDEAGLRRKYDRIVSSWAEGVASPKLYVPPGSVSADLDAARRWKKLFPAGFKALGRGEPLTLTDFSFYHGKVKITFACDRRLVLIEDNPRLLPAMLGWDSAAPAPLIHQLPAGDEPADGGPHRGDAGNSGRSTQRRPIAKSKRRGGR